MKYCSGWLKVKARFEALWQGEIIDRCCAAVMAPTGDTREACRLPADPHERVLFRTDGEWVLKRNLTVYENTYFAGDAIPIIFPDLGAAGHAGFFKNAKYQIEDTVWFFPSIENWERDSVIFDRDSFYSYPTEDTKSREKAAHSNKYKGNGSADGEFVIKRTLFDSPN